MNNWTKFEKIKQIKENDKNEVQIQFRQAVDEFEKYAEELLHLLKKKEAMEVAYQNSLIDGSIDKMKGYYNYLNYLTPNILSVQKKVNHARDCMNKLQEELTQQYIEVKKFEKIIDRKKQVEYLLINKKEQSTMDEISIRKYTDSKGR
jgi:flagellar protein FliJ